MTHQVGLPLRPGSEGVDVVDLQRRLLRAGYDPGPLDGRFGERTGSCLEAFQRHRGLETTGNCDRSTWTALVEASWRLGERHLYLHAPMLRGDDVADLQLHLGRLGFDAGRVDGIFGPDTHRALLEFQENSGLVTDGIVGPDTVATLARLGGRSGPEPVASVRERERLRGDAGALTGRRILVGDLGGAATLVGHTARRLRERGALAVPAEQQDPSAQARLANDAGAVAYVGVQVTPTPDLLVAHFATPGFTSQGGIRMGDSLADAIRSAGLGEAARAGLRLPILRETRMPAVYLKLGPTTAVARTVPRLAEAIADGIELWLRAPVERDPQGYPQPGDKPATST